MRRSSSADGGWTGTATSSVTTAGTADRSPAGLRGQAALGQRAGRGHEAEVAERLREVAEERQVARVDLLGVQAGVVGQPRQLIHELGGLVGASGRAQRL